MKQGFDNNDFETTNHFLRQSYLLRVLFNLDNVYLISHVPPQPPPLRSLVSFAVAPARSIMSLDPIPRIRGGRSTRDRWRTEANGSGRKIKCGTRSPGYCAGVNRERLWKRVPGQTGRA